VNKATSTTTVVFGESFQRGQTVKFTATVTSPTTTPTGTVTFMDGSAVPGTGTLAAGKASYSTSVLSYAAAALAVHLSIVEKSTAINKTRFTSRNPQRRTIGRLKLTI
jgi:hypothetical protein